MVQWQCSGRKEGQVAISMGHEDFKIRAERHEGL
jgi:hypothetical protein